jgi:hypothetical protein
VKWLIAVLSLTIAGCAQSANSPEALEDRVLATGTFFGFCHGYCNTELVVDGDSLRYIESSRDPVQFPTRTRVLPLSAGERARLASLTDPAVLSSLEGVHGCPDCADGGGEWVQIRSGADSTRVTFEYGKTLDPIAALQTELRALRQRFQ